MKTAILALAAAATLAACAPLSDSQRAGLSALAAGMNRQAAASRQIGAQNQQAVAAWGQAYAQPATTTNCTTSYVMGTAYTHCQ